MSRTPTASSDSLTNSVDDPGVALHDERAGPGLREQGVGEHVVRRAPVAGGVVDHAFLRIPHEDVRIDLGRLEHDQLPGGQRARRRRRRRAQRGEQGGGRRARLTTTRVATDSRDAPSSGNVVRRIERVTRELLAGAGVTGALAATNRALRHAALPTNALGGVRLPWTWRGHEIFATAAGAGSPVLLVHGISVGASSYEFRHLARLLAQRHRVIAIDLLGCGLSDKPNLDYASDLFVEQIADALHELAGEPAAIVASSLGAAFAIRAAARTPERVARLAVICPAGVNGELTSGPRGADAALAALLRAPLLGEGTYNTLASKSAIRSFLRREAYADRDHVTPEIVDHYYAVAHQPGARFVPAAFVGHALDCDVARDLPFLNLPLLVLWGYCTRSVAPRANADDVVRLARNAQLVTFANSALLPHDEEPEAAAAALESFLAPQTMTA